MLLLFSYFDARAVTYTDNIGFKDNCGHEIELRVIRTLENVYGECGLVKCEVQAIPLNNTGQYIDQYSNMVWDNGNSIAEIYNFNTPVYFFYPNPGIYGINFTIDIVTYCGTYTYLFTPPYYNNLVTVLGCNDEKCTSSFSYCEFYSGQTSEEEMPTIQSVTYMDPASGLQELNNSNNGVFHFPYYCHDANLCDLHPNLFDFVNDMNTYLLQTGIGGVCEFYKTNLPYYCKNYIRYINTGVFFTMIGISDTLYKITPVGCCPKNPFLAYPVNISQDFPISTSCLSGNIAVGESDIWQVYEENENIKMELISGINTKGENEVSCYPSITDGELYIDNKAGNNYKLYIYSLSGRIVNYFKVNEMMKKINLSGCNPGMYFLRFIDEESGIVKSDKIIIR